MPRSDIPVEHIATQPWMAEEPTRAVLEALGPGNARFAGGAVRDTLLGRLVTDIDIATPLLPEQATRRLEAAGIAVVPTGLQHGTVTAVVPPRHFEITTLRRDVETFGRHARVAFTEDWAEDAARRDFTMNALYLDPGGNIYDFVGGLVDLRAGRVRFVGDPRERIREDVLRLLRFYRFYAHYGKGLADAEARAAARAAAPLLPNLSGERVAAEVKRLLAARDPLPTLVMMTEDDVLHVILPETRGLQRLAALAPLEPEPDPVRRLGALIATNVAAAEAVARRLKLKKTERDRLVALAAPPLAIDLAAPEREQRRALYRLGPALYADLVLLRAAETDEAAQAKGLLALAAAWQRPRFPVKGRDLTARGLAPGPEIGRLLGEVEAWWEAGDFAADRKACLAELEQRMRG